MHAPVFCTDAVQAPSQRTSPKNCMQGVASVPFGQPVWRDGKPPWYPCHHRLPCPANCAAAAVCRRCCDLQDTVNLADLLAFADAVGSSRGVMKACMTSLSGSLTITVNLKQFQEQQRQHLLQEQQQHQQHQHQPHPQWENDSDNGSIDEAFAVLAGAFAEQQEEPILPPAPTLAPPKLTFDLDAGRAYYFQVCAAE